MKYPLQWRHRLGRQFVCWCVGHRWKFSWRSRDDRRDREERSERGTLTYRERHEGNPYCWNSAGWAVKCARCRRRSRDDAFRPWLAHLWWSASRCFSLRSVWQNRPSAHREPGYGYGVMGWHHWLLAMVLAWPIEASAQLACHVFTDARYVPRSLFDWALDVEFWFYEWLDEHTAYYRWTPPRDGVPGSVGFWQLADAYNPDMTITMQTGTSGVPLFTGSAVETQTWTSSTAGMTAMEKS